MSTQDELGPYADIAQVIRMPDGSLLAYDAENEIIAELDEEGLKQLQDVISFIVVNSKDLGEHSSTKPMGIGMPYGAPSGAALGTAGGMTYIRPVRVLVDSPVYLHPGTSPSLVDGVNLRKGDRVLVVGQADPKDNGLFDVARTDQGSRSGMTPSHSWLRANDKIVNGTATMVTEGRDYGDTLWVYDADGAQWIQLGAAAGTVPSPEVDDDIEDLFDKMFPPDAEADKDAENDLADLLSDLL